MKVKIKGEPIECKVQMVGGRLMPVLPECGSNFHSMVAALRGQWVEVETAHVFNTQYNTAPVDGITSNGLRVDLSHIAEIDFEGDDTLQAVVEAMSQGRIRCHHYQHRKANKVGRFVDLSINGKRVGNTTKPNHSGEVYRAIAAALWPPTPKV